MKEAKPPARILISCEMKILKAIKHFFKVRYTAKRFNIWTEKIEDDYYEGYWLGYDGVIYYGARWFLFFKSSQNEWWLSESFKYKREFIISSLFPNASD